MLEDLAGHCRRALEAMTMSERGARLRDFPHGACGDAAEVFGRIVRETMGRVGVYALVEGATRSCRPSNLTPGSSSMA